MAPEPTVESPIVQQQEDLKPPEPPVTPPEAVAAACEEARRVMGKQPERGPRGRSGAEARSASMPTGPLPNWNFGQDWKLQFENPENTTDSEIISTLQVPLTGEYKEKDMKLGARWDQHLKQFCVQPGKPLVPFMKWVPVSLARDLVGLQKSTITGSQQGSRNASRQAERPPSGAPAGVRSLAPQQRHRRHSRRHQPGEKTLGSWAHSLDSRTGRCTVSAPSRRAGRRGPYRRCTATCLYQPPPQFRRLPPLGAQQLRIKQVKEQRRSPEMKALNVYDGAPPSVKAMLTELCTRVVTAPIRHALERAVFCIFFHSC